MSLKNATFIYPSRYMIPFSGPNSLVFSFFQFAASNLSYDSCRCIWQDIRARVGYHCIDGVRYGKILVWFMTYTEILDIHLRIYSVLGDGT